MSEEFKAELSRIAAGSEPLQIVEIEDPASYGWLRRPEHDRLGIAAWERPDGTLCGIEKNRTST